MHWHVIIHAFKLLSTFLVWFAHTRTPKQCGMSEGHQLQTQTRSSLKASGPESWQTVQLPSRGIAKMVTQVFAIIYLSKPYVKLVKLSVNHSFLLSSPYTSLLPPQEKNIDSKQNIWQQQIIIEKYKFVIYTVADRKI